MAAASLQRRRKDAMKARADVAGRPLAGEPRTTAMIAFLVATAFALAGVASALSIHDADAAATIHSRRQHPHWSALAVGRVWHHPAGETTDSRNDPQT
jgi:hypothetical protein